MFRQTKGVIVGFIAGILVAISLGVAFAAPIEKTITALYDDIKLYVDGVLVTPKDANGNIVEPFIYDGTTYLPVRALSEALGKNVKWDGSTSSVIIGLMPGDVVYFDDVLQPYQIQGDYWQADVGNGEYFLMAGEKYYHGGYREGYYWSDGGSDADLWYNLNSQYSQLSGIYGKEDSMNNDGIINFYADGCLIKTLEIKAGEMPKDFSVDLNGILQLRIELKEQGTAIANWQIR